MYTCSMQIHSSSSPQVSTEFLPHPPPPSIANFSHPVVGLFAACFWHVTPSLKPSVAPHACHTQHQLLGLLLSPWLTWGHSFSFSGPSFPSCGVRPCQDNLPFILMEKRSTLASRKGGGAQVWAALPSCCVLGTLPGPSGWVAVEASLGLHACIQRLPLGVWRRERVLGLWTLLAGAPEGLVAQEPPQAPSTFGAVTEGSPGKALHVSGAANGLSKPQPLSQPEAWLSPPWTATILPTPAKVDMFGPCLCCWHGGASPLAQPEPLGHFLLPSGWWALSGLPPSAFPEIPMSAPQGWARLGGPRTSHQKTREG